MAFNMHSGQFNAETTPTRLGNMQVPRWSPSKPRPVEMRPDPRPICDNNGHFLPGVPRGTSKCFGHFVGTWDLPNKITREVAAKLTQEPPPGRFVDWVNLRVRRPKAAEEARRRAAELAKGRKIAPPEPEDPYPYSDSKQQDLEIEEPGNETQHQENQESAKERDKTNSDSKTLNLTENKNHKDEDDPLGILDKKEPVDACGATPYIPGSLTDPDKRHDSYDRLVQEAVEKIHGPQENNDYKFWRKVAENAAEHEKSQAEDMKLKKKESQTPKLPKVDVSQNFQFAKNMQVGNLQHQPLPDTLGSRKFTKVGEHRDSDIIVKPYAIGWKGYGASGPTCCTKLRVHRPKTCDPRKTDGEKDDSKRPLTSAPNLGRPKKPLSLMDLAICWDFKPDDPQQEPKPPKHIDGSNGSKAPAVFTMVHTPKEEPEDLMGHANSIFNQNTNVIGNVGRHPVPYFEKDMTKEKRKDSCEVQHCPQHCNEKDIKRDKAEKPSSLASRRSSVQSLACDGIHGCGTPSVTNQKSSKSSSRSEKLEVESVREACSLNRKEKNNYDINRNRNSLESYDKTPLAQGMLHQSSPKDSQRSQHVSKESVSSNSNNIKHKNCLSCNGTKIPIEQRQKEDYKFAFKAGNPNSVQSNSSATTDSKVVKIPKLRHPYSKKSYTIPTLAPPFSIWRNANATGYPEHWRLASVYQHAYKPPDQRRKPLIDSVYQ